MQKQTDETEIQRSDIFPIEQEPGFWKKNVSTIKKAREEHKAKWIAYWLSKGFTEVQAYNKYQMYMDGKRG